MALLVTFSKLYASITFTFIQLKKIFNHCLSFLYPSFCRHCFEIVPDDCVLCALCRGTLKRCSSLTFAITPTKKSVVVALAVYEGIVRTLILKKHSRDYSSPLDLARLWISTLSLDVKSIDYLVPIPLHWTRRMQRGFNQAEIIAQTLGKHYSIPLVNALNRTKKTKFQSTLSAQEREENIKQCFKLSKKSLQLIKGKRIVLVDDLCTTGTTLKEAAKLLYKAGALSVNACVMARTK